MTWAHEATPWVVQSAGLHDSMRSGSREDANSTVCRLLLSVDFVEVCFEVGL
jgi:hypothetical protein